MQVAGPRPCRAGAAGEPSPSHTQLQTRCRRTQPATNERHWPMPCTYTACCLAPYYQLRFATRTHTPSCRGVPSSARRIAAAPAGQPVLDPLLELGVGAQVVHGDGAAAEGVGGGREQVALDRGAVQRHLLFGAGAGPHRAWHNTHTHGWRELKAAMGSADSMLVARPAPGGRCWTERHWGRRSPKHRTAAVASKQAAQRPADPGPGPGGTGAPHRRAGAAPASPAARRGRA